jgi:tartrate-resistant acid phosphatase type 5
MWLVETSKGQTVRAAQAARLIGASLLTALVAVLAFVPAGRGLYRAEAVFGGMVPPVRSAALMADRVSSNSVRFAVIGDYGLPGQAAQDVANLVAGWNPDFIITTGDNNYPAGEASTIDRNVGQYYSRFIAPYKGAYGPGAVVNRFFPALGNHDLATAGARPYLEYFTLPGNGRYYDFTWGPVHLFALNSDPREPDGVSAGSPQAQWLRSRLSASQARLNVVYMHHPPYSSGRHGSSVWMQWPYGEWGAQVVLAGHDHTYERIVRDGVVYFVNGLGGVSAYPFRPVPVEGSAVRFNADFGAMLVTVTADQATFEFVTRRGELVDRYSLSLARLGMETVRPTPVPARAP